MSSASSYDEWREAALEHDQKTGMDAWKTSEESKSYDWTNIKSRLENLRALRASNDDVGLLFALNEGIHGNQGGMGKTLLYERAKIGTKQLIEEYVDEVVDALNHIASLPPSESITLDDKVDFFHRASLCFGRSALMLSGAGSLGHFHQGVVKTLFEHDLLPNVISGSSAGSIFAAVVGTHSNDELTELFNSEHLGSYQQQDIDSRSGSMFRDQIDASVLRLMLEEVIPDMTFQEAYEKTGRMISVTIAPAEEHQNSRLMNAVTSPNVYVRSAVTASCAVPGVFPPVMLMAKNVYGEPQPYLPNRRWVDGAITDDLPAKRLARLYGVNHYIVSQANPLTLAMTAVEENLWLPEVTKNIMRATSHELLKSGEKFSRRYLRQIPDVGRAMSMFYSVVAQEYKGDINIAPNFNIVDPQKLLAQLTSDEIKELVIEGERAAWTRLEQVRISSKIGYTLDRILDDHDDHNVKRFYKQRKSKS